ncbi:class I SAM-dependent DNA methyltransferase [Anaerocolumna xylanovorans]|uniref:Methyltransferase domain-containing protein n=1 Tax=Anaerocolumna xylanovorans DSM 12503 TaxID=1121345 RepID=A0A1M7YH50_9FIRM|nr:class I SAM-dependent methyltransferase [Anaerocolumna xylanovorans]SHO51987.1 Methyltransferase domain-containing protein [Anaerocolumna xylanovorans DSM 12503]
MEAYTGFAQVYDKFMDNVPYDKWAEDIRKILTKQGILEGILLDLGCGTGSITRRLAGYGYDMIGIDISEEMLQIAIEKKYEEDENPTGNSKEKDILYLKQDMRNFELYGTVSGVICICDSLNYITKEEELLSIFSLVNNYLEAGGIFLFDMNTEYKYKEILGENVIAENREDCSFIWENYFDEKENINEYQVTIFVEAEEEEENKHRKSKLYEKFSETHYQKAYSIDTVKSLLEKAGMEFIGVYEAFTENPPTQTSERVCFLAREKFQTGKVYR